LQDDKVRMALSIFADDMACCVARWAIIDTHSGTDQKTERKETQNQLPWKLGL